MYFEAPYKLSSLPSVISPEGAPVLRGRLKSPSDLVDQFQTFYMADLQSSLQRTLAQEQRDGVPPYSPVRERALGLAGRTNVNWQILDHAATEAEAPYNDILDGIDEFCTMPTNFGDESSRIYWEQVIAEEFSRMLRSWPQFYPRWQQNVMIFVGEGLSFAFFDDDLDWRWTIKGQQFMKFPRRTDADINVLDIMTAGVEMLPHKLFEHCQDKEAAIEEGWNPDVVWQTIKQYAGQYGLRPNDLQQWEAAWKNNDQILGTSNLVVPTIHGWVRELDGSVSHYIGPADSASVEDNGFLYKREGKYRRMSNMICPYTLGVGANGMFHSIRGLYQKAFASSSGLNRALCRLLDMSIHGSTPWIQTDQEDTLTELPLIPMGQYGVLKPGVTFVEAKVAPFEQTIIPAMNYLQQVFNTRTSPFSTPSSQGLDKTERTAYEKQMQYEKEGKLSTSGMLNFKAHWTGHVKEIARRACRKGYASNEPGGEEVTSFRARCHDRGVPMEAIDMIDIDRIEANLGLGKGSASERRVVVDTLNTTVYYRLDPQGQNQLNNMTVAAYAGTRIAGILAPVKQGMRPPEDLWQANMENQVMTLGGEPDFQPNQNHLVHAQAHTNELGKLNEALVSQQIHLEQAIPMMGKIQAHANQHMEMVDQQDPTAATLKETLTALNEVIMNGSKQLFAEQEKAQREMEHNYPNGGAPGQNGNGQQPQDPEAQAAATEANSSTLVQAAQAQQKIQDANLLTSQKLQHRELEFRQKQAIRDAEAAAQIRRGK